MTRAHRQLSLAFLCCFFLSLRLLTLNIKAFPRLGEYLSLELPSDLKFTVERGDTFADLPENQAGRRSPPEHGVLLGFNTYKFKNQANKSEISDGQDGMDFSQTSLDPNGKALTLHNTSFALPQWAVNYFQWHRRMREIYPDRELIDNPEAPGILVHYCMPVPYDSKCGGLHDRLGKLSRMVAIASLTNRIILYKWYEPHALESFLTPNVINWTVPDHQLFEKTNFGRQRLPHVTDNYVGSVKEQMSIVEWMNHADFANQKILLTMHNIRYDPPSEMEVDDENVFGEIFRAFFKPSQSVQEMINKTWSSLGIIPGHYNAVHCRVRHPGRFSIGALVQGKNNASDPDSSGLQFQGEYKDMAVRSAIRAIRCSKQLLKSAGEPIYLLSDSEDLVNYIIERTQPENAIIHSRNSTEPIQSDVDRLALDRLSGVSIVSRDVSLYPTLHLDLQIGYPVEYYYSTFVDLFLAVAARCVTFGVGNFGYLATRISGTRCTQIHEKMQTKRLSKRYNQQKGSAPFCKIRG